MNALLEILTTKKWMVSPDYLHGIRGMLEGNLNGHIAVEYDAKELPFAMVANAEGNGYVEDRCVTENGESEYGSDFESMRSPFVNVMPIKGPITRSGGLCTYGSREIRDMLIKASDSELCRGHIFVIDSPGGSSWAKNDFKQGIDYAHSKGLKVTAFIDGLCASAAFCLASFCDEVYYMHPKDIIGCVGTMAAFYTEKNGSYSKYSNETYHELYDPESYDKNRLWRDIANDGVDDLLIEELRADGEEFRNIVKAAFPAVTDEHIHGKEFACADVEGIMCDGQRTFDEVVQRTFDLGNGAEPLVRAAAASKQEEEVCKPKKNGNSNQKSEENMKNYKFIATICGIETLVATAEGSFLNTDLLDSLEQHLSEVDGKMTEKDNALVEAKKQFDTQLAKAQADKAAEIEQLNNDHEAKMGEAQKALDEANAAKAAMEQTIAELRNDLSTRDAKIKELTEKPADAPQQSPASNGAGEGFKSDYPTYDSNKSPMENQKALEEYRKRHCI